MKVAYDKNKSASTSTAKNKTPSTSSATTNKTPSTPSATKNKITSASSAGGKRKLESPEIEYTMEKKTAGNTIQKAFQTAKNAKKKK